MYSDDASLCANSECRPAGNDCGLLIGAVNVGCDECDSPIEEMSWGNVKARFR
jgi:hypothetical protein